MTEYRTIWLEPGCVSESNEDRHWAQDDPWGACEDCGQKSVKYIIATEYDALVKAIWNLCALAERHGLEGSPMVEAARRAISAAVSTPQGSGK